MGSTYKYLGCWVLEIWVANVLNLMTNPLAKEALFETRSHNRVTFRILVEVTFILNIHYKLSNTYFL